MLFTKENRIIVKFYKGKINVVVQVSY